MKTRIGTIAVYPVAWEEASRFGILVTDKQDNITDFQEKREEADFEFGLDGYLYLPV